MVPRSQKRGQKSQQRKLKNISALNDSREIPAWIDDVFRKAVHPDPYKRYEELSEYVFELRHPNKNYLRSSPTPLMECTPLLFWKCLALVLACIIYGCSSSN